MSTTTNQTITLTIDTTGDQMQALLALAFERIEAERDALAYTAEQLAQALEEAEAEAAEQAENARGHAAIADRLAQELKEAHQEARDQKGMAERYRDRFHKATAERNEAREQLEALKRDHEQAEDEAAEERAARQSAEARIVKLEDERDQLQKEIEQAEKREAVNIRLSLELLALYRINEENAAENGNEEREEYWANARISANAIVEAMTGDYAFMFDPYPTSGGEWACTVQLKGETYPFVIEPIF